jgi:uncharacterized membrane protein HdeD (DUF308 family)
LLLLRGIALVVLGFYALFNPGLSLLLWAVVVGYFFIIDGILAIVAGVAGWGGSRAWTVVRGVLAILVGGIALAHPALFGSLAGLTVIAIIAAFAIALGIMEIIVAIRERKAIEGEGWMILNGVFTILFGVVLFMAPMISLAIFIRICGAFAILAGLIVVFTSLRLRKLKPA